MIPQYAHTGVLLDENGKKISKRTKAELVRQELRRRMQNGETLQMLCTKINNFIKKGQ